MFKFLSAASLLIIGVVMGVLVTAFTPLGAMLRPATQVTGTFVPLVDRITQLREITTVRFNYANIVTSERDMPGVLNALYGDRQVMVAVGHIEAGIDMGEISADDMIYDAEAGILTLNLPPTAIQSCFLNENESYVVSRDSGIFAAPAPDLDSAARRFALSQARIRAVEDDILGVAQKEAEIAVKEFVDLFVDESITVEVNVADPDPNVPLPDTCP